MAGITAIKLSLSPSIRSSSASFSCNPSFNGLRHSIALPRRKIYALSSNDIKVGTNIEVDGAPWKVLVNTAE
ncbi:Elongation factor P [Bienertia sinuspersici]